MGTSITVGRLLPRASRTRGTDVVALGDARGVGAERLGELHEVGVAQLGADLAAAEALALVAVGVAVRVVVVDDGDGVDPVLHRGGELGGGEQEAAVAGRAHHRRVGAGHLHAERGGEAPPERAHVAGRQVGARPVRRIEHVAHVPHGRGARHEHAVVGDGGAELVDHQRLRPDRARATRRRWPGTR